MEIKEGEVAEFELDREQLENLLDILPPEHKSILFKMDFEGKVSVIAPAFGKDD